jgi:hypothetical protein
MSAHARELIVLPGVGQPICENESYRTLSRYLPAHSSNLAPIINAKKMVSTSGPRSGSPGVTAEGSLL